MTIGWNDSTVWDNRTDQFISDYLTGEGPTGLEGFLSHSAIYRALKKAIYSFQASGSSATRIPRVPVASFLQNLDAIGREAERLEARVVLILWACRGQMDAPAPVLRPHQRALMRFSEQHGLPLVNLIPVLRRAGGSSLFIDNGHLTPKGYRLVAAAVAEVLESKGLIRRQ